MRSHPFVLHKPRIHDASVRDELTSDEPLPPRTSASLDQRRP